MVNDGIASGTYQIVELEKWCFAQADALLRIRGLVVDEASRGKLAKAIAIAVQRASLALGRFARGQFRNAEAGSAGGEASR